MTVIYDPSRIKAVVTKNVGKSGQYLTKMAEDNDALLAINGGGFNDPNFNGTGGAPLGITVCNGKYITTDTYAGSGGVIGFTEDNKFVLGKMTLSQAKKMKIRDAVTFGPFLIVNGKPSAVHGNGGWGTAPRTAIAQRKDGIVLFLVLDGNRALGKGATIKDLIDIFDRYGAVNASNLDGGTSTSMTVRGKTVNNPTNLSGGNGTRPIPSAFILKPDDSDDGDYSVVKDKVDN